MKRIVMLAVACAGWPAVAGAQAMQFDLVCSGPRQQGVNGSPAPHTERYRIDLEGSRWCQGECKAGLPFVEVTTDNFILEKKSESPPLYATINHVISRTAATVHLGVISRDYVEKFDGRCEVAPFSGMPTPKF